MRGNMNVTHVSLSNSLQESPAGLGFDRVYGENRKHEWDFTTEERLRDASLVLASTSSHSSISLPAEFTQSHVSYREGHLKLHADCRKRYENKRATLFLSTGLHDIQGVDEHIQARKKP
jgi:hypothetical protein